MNPSACVWSEGGGGSGCCCCCCCPEQQEYTPHSHFQRGRGWRQPSSSLLPRTKGVHPPTRVCSKGWGGVDRHRCCHCPEQKNTPHSHLQRGRGWCWLLSSWCQPSQCTHCLPCEQWLTAVAGGARCVVPVVARPASVMFTVGRASLGAACHAPRKYVLYLLYTPLVPS
jgi:hypothetical protein